jgi:uncharacterized protein (DUF1330 family)
MAEIKTDLDALEAVRKLMPENSPFVMVNLLRYRPQADYGDRPDVAPMSGRDAYYQGHLALTIRLVRQLGGHVQWFGHVQVPIFAPKEEHWDDVFLMHYPSFDTVLALMAEPEYKATLFHRTAALADRRVFATVAAEEIV